MQEVVCATALPNLNTLNAQCVKITIEKTCSFGKRS